MKPLKPRRLFLAVYIGILLFLAVRPKIPMLYDNFLPSSSIGGWNMYTYKVDKIIDVYIKTPTGIIPVDWRKNFYHSTFVSSAHPNFRRNMGTNYLEFLDKTSSLIHSLKEKNISFSLHLDILIVKNEADSTVFNFVKQYEENARN